MTRKDYIKIAEAIRKVEKLGFDFNGYRLVRNHDVISELCRILKKANPNFNSDKFIDACYR